MVASLTSAVTILGFSASFLIFAVFYKPDGAPKVNFAPVRQDIEDTNLAIKRFAGLLSFRTVSSSQRSDHAVDSAEFKALHTYLRKEWWRVFEHLETKTVAELSLLLKWQGSEAALPPLLCISHLDVVAAGPDSEWRFPPFGGTLADGYVWGRGALDVKGIAAALLESVSTLIQQG